MVYQRRGAYNVYADVGKEGQPQQSTTVPPVETYKMTAGRTTGVPDLSTHVPARGYKAVDSRVDIRNTLHFGGYQGQSGNAGWSDNVHMPFDQPGRFGTGAYSRFIGGSAGYVPSGDSNNLQNTKTTIMTPNTSSTQVTSNAAIVASVMNGSSDLETDAGQARDSWQDKGTQINNDDIAHHFVFRYYSLLYSNPTGIFNLYAKSGQLCKPDINGNRVVATGHSEIKSYYSQFSQNQLTAVIKKIEVQPLGTHGALIVLVVGEVHIRVGAVKDARVLSQLFVLCGDQTRSRFHIANDIAVTDTSTREDCQTVVRQIEPEKSVEDTTPKSKSKPRAQTSAKNQSPQHIENGFTNGKEVRDKAKIVLFGLPPNTTAEEVKSALTGRLKSKTQLEGRISRVDLKRHHNNSDKSPMYAFVHVDSREAAEALVGEGLTVRGKAVNVEMYKRNNAVRDGAAAH